MLSFKCYLSVYAIVRGNQHTRKAKDVLEPDESMPPAMPWPPWLEKVRDDFSMTPTSTLDVGQEIKVGSLVLILADADQTPATSAYVNFVPADESPASAQSNIDFGTLGTVLKIVAPDKTFLVDSYGKRRFEIPAKNLRLLTDPCVQAMKWEKVYYNGKVGHITSLSHTGREGVEFCDPISRSSCVSVPKSADQLSISVSGQKVDRDKLALEMRDKIRMCVQEVPFGSAPIYQFSCGLQYGISSNFAGVNIPMPLDYLPLNYEGVKNLAKRVRDHPGHKELNFPECHRAFLQKRIRNARQTARCLAHAAQFLVGKGNTGFKLLEQQEEDTDIVTEWTRIVNSKAELSQALCQDSAIPKPLPRRVSLLSIISMSMISQGNNGVVWRITTSNENAYAVKIVLTHMDQQTHPAARESRFYPILKVRTSPNHIVNLLGFGAGEVEDQPDLNRRFFEQISEGKSFTVDGGDQVNFMSVRQIKEGLNTIGFRFDTGTHSSTCGHPIVVSFQDEIASGSWEILPMDEVKLQDGQDDPMEGKIHLVATGKDGTDLFYRIEFTGDGTSVNGKVYLHQLSENIEQGSVVFKISDVDGIFGDGKIPMAAHFGIVTGDLGDGKFNVEFTDREEQLARENIMMAHAEMAKNDDSVLFTHDLWVNPPKVTKVERDTDEKTLQFFNDKSKVVLQTSQKLQVVRKGQYRNPFTVWDWFSGGEFKDVMERTIAELELEGKSPRPQAEVALLSIFDLTTAVGLIHTQHVAHMDIKSHNALLGDGSEGYKLYLADFDTLVEYKNPNEIAKTEKNGVGGTPSYWPPEFSMNDRKQLMVLVKGFADRMDIWSIALVIIDYLLIKKEHRQYCFPMTGNKKSLCSATETGIQVLGQEEVTGMLKNPADKPVVRWSELDIHEAGDGHTDLLKDLLVSMTKLDIHSRANAKDVLKTLRARGFGETGVQGLRHRFTVHNIYSPGTPEGTVSPGSEKA